MITVYISSVTLKKEIHSQQNHIETVLRAKHVEYELIDIASDSAFKEEMRRKCDDEKALAPQIFNGNIHCGDYKSFQQAVEEEIVLDYLGLPGPASSQSQTASA